MTNTLTLEQVTDCGIAKDLASNVTAHINAVLKNHTADSAWQNISKKILSPQLPFKLHLLCFSACYPQWRDHIESAPAWIPKADQIQQANLSKLMQQVQKNQLKDFHQWSTEHYQEFWQLMIQQLGIIFQKKPKSICDLSHGVENPEWLPGAKLNIIESCLAADPKKPALFFPDKLGNINSLSYGELQSLCHQIANGLKQHGFQPGDAIAIDMPMTKEAVAIYLGIILFGGVVVSIADSFSAEEIATRLRIAKAKGIFTQDIIFRGKKQLPLYEKVIAAQAPKAIVIPAENILAVPLRSDDVEWKNFLSENENFSPYACNPMDACNILFSSGTTGDPKAIIWNHTTPIKAASDAYLHQNIQPSDVLAWPTNLGWMMGPWLIFAALINRASVAIYSDVPTDLAFGKFIQDAKVTMLGVVPTLVSSWRQSHCMEGLNWEAIKVFSSTGECSNPEDMLYLMSLAGYKPVIEYCGGTEIGGCYVTSTVIEKNYPSLFTTPAMGINLKLMDENGQISQHGEVVLIPPSIGLSTQLLNADHHKVYFANMPKLNHQVLRRHGDQLQQLSNGCYCVVGRVDDTMNLGGIKVSSVEIERALVGLDDITETAAIGVSPPHHGPSQLIIYAATQKALDTLSIKQLMQKRINQHLNPLFKIHDVIFIKDLPKTASNKIMRRVLKKQYQEEMGKAE